jgi:hypothetical protein
LHATVGNSTQIDHFLGEYKSDSISRAVLFVITAQRSRVGGRYPEAQGCGELAQPNRRRDSRDGLDVNQRHSHTRI